MVDACNITIAIEFDSLPCIPVVWPITFSYSSKDLF